MPTTALPFDDIRNLLAVMPRASDPPRVDSVGLGRLAELNGFLGQWRKDGSTRVSRPLLVLFAASHGVAANLRHGDLGEDARKSMEQIAAGEAPINRVCAAFEVGLRVFELALSRPTGDISRGAALEEAHCAATMAYGMEAIADSVDLLCVGALSGDADIPAASILHALYGGRMHDWFARGEAHDKRAIELAAKAAKLHASAADPLEILRRLGGRDLAAIAGAILAARMERIPVVLDGLAAAAAGAVLHALNEGALHHCVASQASSEAHERALRRIGKTPLLALGVSDETGCAAPLAVALFRAAAAAGAPPPWISVA